MKDETITIRIAKEEKLLLRKLANESNLSISKYLTYTGLLGKKLKITKIIEVEKQLC